jgi:hypothetical protein
MHLVLDGAATPDEAAELERDLSADPAARAEYARLEALFAGLAAIPGAHPPEGLVAAVMAAVPDQPPTRGGVGGSVQLFDESGVIGETSDTILPMGRGRAGSVEPVVQPKFYFKGESMNGQQKRNVWIGGGVAAVAAVLLVSFGMNVPPRSSDTAGTIAPAQRYRADQNTSDNVNAAQAGGQTMQVVPRGQPALAAQAESNAVNNATNSATAKAVDSATAKAVDSATAKAVDSATAKAVDSATAKAVDSATAKAVDSATAKAVDSATAKAVDSATAKAVDSATAKAVDSATAKAVNNATIK